MKECFVIPILAALLLASAAPLRGENAGTPSAPLKITIDASVTKAPISKYIYGQFIEHLGRCIYGGMWAEMLEDRKFYYPVTGRFQPWSIIEDTRRRTSFPALTGSPWKIIGENGAVIMVSDNAYVGEHTPETLLPGDGRPRGVAQGDLALTAGRRYVGRIVLACTPQVECIKVSLVWGKGKSDRQTVLIGKVPEDYVKIPLSFCSRGTTEKGQLEIVGLGEGSFNIGAVSLMPADNVEGWRADTLKLLKELDAPVYRWPGGNFVSGYDWQDGVGDPDRRAPRKNPAWTGIEHNDVGIDEFMTLCGLLNTEPYVTVNTGLGAVENAVREVEYCNAPANSPWGLLRAENGHPEPYRVKYWAIGNEMYSRGQKGFVPLEEYVKKHEQCVEAMRAADPLIQVVGVGRAGTWSETMLKECPNHMDMMSEHFYCKDKEDVAAHAAQIPDNIRKIADAHREYRRAIPSLVGKDIRIAMDEWNYWYGHYVYGELGTRYFLKDALGIAAGLHEYFRNSDIIFMANYAQTVNVIGAIKTSKTAAQFETTGQVLKMYRNHYGVIPVEVSGAPSPIDVAAAWTEDRKSLAISVVNPTDSPCELELDVKNASLWPSGRMWRVAGPDPMAYNEPGKEPKVKIEESGAELVSGKLKAAPLSASLFRFPVK